MFRESLGISAAFLVALVGALGCTSEKSGGAAGKGGEQAAGSGGGGATAGSGGRASGGGSGGMAGSTGGAPLLRGDVLEFVPGTGEVPYAIGENPYGIRGGGFLARSPLGNTITVGDDVGEICIQGNLEEVPNGDYSQYWGVEVGFNLNQTALDDGAGGAGGADGAAGAGGSDGTDVAEPWLPGSVIGFSFVIEGPTIDLIRFKSLPSGYDPALEASVFCRTVVATSGQVNDALFTQMIQYCWNATGTPLPTAAGLANISWQLPADVAVGARPFDWCLKELRPILMP
jgi:hypothetical protein